MSSTKKGELKKFGVALFIIACVILLADIWMAGITNRYMYDFTFIFVMVGVIVAFWNVDSARSSEGKIKHFLLNCAVLGSFFIQAVAILILDIQCGIYLRNPDLYYYLEILFRM